MKANEIRNLLEQRVAILTGGRDKSGTSIITFPSCTVCEQLTFENVKQILSYFVSIASSPNKVPVFTFVVDMRGKKWDSIKPVLNVINEEFSQNVRYVFIIKPDNFWQKQRTSIGSSKYNFDNSLISIEGLHKEIDPSQLTADLNGSFPYDHRQWMEYRLRFESFTQLINDCVQRLDLSTSELSLPENPCDVEQAMKAIENHTAKKAKVAKATTVDPVIREGKTLLKYLIPSDSCPGNAVDQFGDAPKIRVLLESLVLAGERCQNKWIQKRSFLEQCLQLRYFERDSGKLIDWIEQNQQIIALQYTDIGESFSGASELLAAHEQFEKTCLLSSDNSHSIECLRSVASRLVNNNHYAAQTIRSELCCLEQSWKLFQDILENRTKILTASLTFHKKADEYLIHVPDWRRACCTQLTESDDVNSWRKAITNHQELADEISHIYAEICYVGKSILDTIQSPITDELFAGQLEFKRSASHILVIVHEILASHRQLEKLWVDKKRYLHEQLKRAVYRADVRQVLDWIEEHGEAFLQRNTNVGKSVNRARTLLHAHQNFEKVLQNTITNAQKLTYAVEEFSSNAEDDSIVQLSLDLENRIKSFLLKVDERHQILNTSILFHLHYKELSVWLNELEERWCQDEYSVTDIPETVEAIDQKLDELSHELEATVESCDKLMNEGDSLLQYLNRNINEANKNLCKSTFSHIEEMLNTFREKRGLLQTVFESRRAHLEFFFHLKTFETDAIDASQQVEKIAQDLHGSSQNESQWLLFDSGGPFPPNERMAGIIQEIIQRGKDILTLLDGDDLKFIAANRASVQKRIQDVLSYMEQKSSVLTEFAEEQRRRLVSRAEFHRFHQNCSKVLQWINGIEERLQSTFSLALSADEATDCARIHQQIISEAEEVSVVMNTLARRNASIRKHGAVSNLVSEADSLIIRVTRYWQRLLLHIDDRHRLVNSQLHFFSTIQQATNILEALIEDYGASDEDAYKKIMYQADADSLLTAHLRKLEDQKHIFLKACTTARRSTETLLKYSQKNCLNYSKPQSLLNNLNEKIKEKLLEIQHKETSVLNAWTKRKKFLDECLQYTLFEKRAKQLLSWIHNYGETFLSSHSSESNLEKDSLEKSHREFSKFVDALKEKRTNFKNFIDSADNLVYIGHSFAPDIKNLCSQVEKRFHEFIADVEKQRQRLERLLGYDAEGARSFNSSSELTQVNHEKKRFSKKCEFIITELIQTERAYVRDLKTCIDVYLNAFLNEELPENLADQEFKIFGNIETIYKFHENIFLKELEKFESMPEDIGHCFVTWAEQFQAYVHYCMNKEISNSILQSPMVAKFFDSVHRRTNVDPIGSYLIKPVQRITKYQLLLRDLLGCSQLPADELEDALGVMLAVPRKANDTIHLSYLEGLEEGFSKEALGEVLLQESFLIWDSKHFIKKGKERRVFLFEASVLFAKESKDLKGKIRYIYKHKLLTAEIGVTEHIEGDSSKFAVWTGRAPLTDHRIVVKAPNIECKLMWVKKIRELIQEKFLYLESSIAEPVMRPHHKANNLNDMDAHVEDADLTSRDSFSSASNSGNEFITYENAFANANYTTDDFSMVKGEHLQILSRSGEFFLVRSESFQEGLIPSSLVGFTRLSKTGSLDDRLIHNRRKSSLKKWLKTPVRRLSIKDGKLCRDKKIVTPLSASFVDESELHASQQVRTVGQSFDFSDPSTNAPSHFGSSLQSMEDDGEGTDIEVPPPMQIQSRDSSFSTVSNEDTNALLNPEEIEKVNVGLSNAIAELVSTERDYTKSLGVVIDGYIPAVENKDIKKPSSFIGREKFIFGNIRQLYELHKDRFLPELENCKENVSHICSLFATRRFQPYIKYYENQPRSTTLYLEFKDYFEEIRSSLGVKSDLFDLLILPTQRLLRYKLLLQNIEKYYVKLKGNPKPIETAIKALDEIARQAEMFLHLSRLQGFPGGNVLGLGELLKYGKLEIVRYGILLSNSRSEIENFTKPTSQYKSKDYATFLFTQAIIFSEENPPENKYMVPKLTFKFYFKMNKISFTEFQKSTEGPSKDSFILIEMEKDKTRGAICRCKTTEEFENWFQIIFEQLKCQNDFIAALTNPRIAMERKSSELPSSPEKGAKENSKGKSTTAPAKEQNERIMRSSSPRKVRTLFDNLLKSTGVCNSKFKPSYSRRKSHSLERILPREAVVLIDYTAVKEDEISVKHGENVQILAANQQRRFFVNRAANDTSPAAEGWIPGAVIGIASSDDPLH